jgi:transposase
VTVRKMLGYSIPPGYRRKEPVKRPKLGPWMGVIDAILQEDKSQPAKQRHTAKRIFDRLRAEHGFSGGYTIVKDYVRVATLRQREVFIPLAHVAGTAQADFGEALVIVGGEERKAHYLAIDLPHSDDCFVMAFPAETTEAFLEGHIQAFAYFGGVPISILYDNTKLAVARILGDGTRQKTRAFCELQSHYLFADKFGRPAKGNDKGKVEGLVGYARRNFLVPIPRVASWEELTLTRYCDDGRREIDNSAAERALRAVAIGRKNYLFAGSDRGGERAATFYSLIGTAKLNGMDPEAYLREVFTRIADHPISRIEELLPWNIGLPTDR